MLNSYGLAWNPHTSSSSHLLSAAFDSKICHWDVKSTTRDNRRVDPIRVYTGHSTGVEVIRNTYISKQLIIQL